MISLTTGLVHSVKYSPQTRLSLAATLITRPNVIQSDYTVKHLPNVSLETLIQYMFIRTLLNYSYLSVEGSKICQLIVPTSAGVL